MNPNEVLQSAMAVLEQLYPKNGNYEYSIDSEKQKVELRKLEELVKYEHCFFVLDLVKREITHRHGLKKWLGYEDGHFDFPKYLSIIHPRHLESLNIFAKAALDTANSTEFKLGFMEQSYAVELPLLHENGDYITVKRTLYPFQIEKKTGKVLAYINLFKIIKEFDPTVALNPTVTTQPQSKKDTADIEVKKRAKKIIASKKKVAGFNQKQLLILKTIADNPTENVSVVFEMLGIKPTTQKSDMTRIISQAKLHYENDNIMTLKQVAFFVKREGLI